MTNTDKNKLLFFNKIGIIPGPYETSSSFTERAGYCLNLKGNLPPEIENCLKEEASSTAEILEDAIQLTTKFYDIAPQWIPLFYSNYRLPFWHGGCAWIYQLTEDTPTAALIQLRLHFRKSSRYLGLYDRKELLAHELCHVGRMMYQEPKFEEILAYSTSNSRFRRWLSPLVQSSMESVIFVLVVFMLLVFDVFLVSMNRTEAYVMALWLKSIPIAMFLAALVRLWKRQYIFKQCRLRVQDVVGAEHARATLFRLIDAEIIQFSKMTPQEIRQYASSQAEHELRWRIIVQAYFDRDCA